MANFLLKKSYRLSTLAKEDYDPLWGSKGVFTTIRVYGKKPKYIFIKEHLLQLNKSLKKLHINFSLTEKKLLELTTNKLNIKKHNHLLRVAIKKNILSISLRPRLEPSNNFQCELINYQRINAGLKNLQYKKILSMQKNINMQKKEILFNNKKNVLEGSTTNLILIKDNQIILPKGSYYKGITISFLLKKINNKHTFKSISFFDLSNADEIILVGSGKGVVKVTSIPKINWFSSSSKMFKIFFSIYKSQLNL